MTRFSRFVQILVPVVALCLTVGATSAFAQSYEANLRSQINTLLTSDNADMQESGIRLVMQLSESDAAAVNPRAFRDHLFDIYLDTDGPDAVRIAAVDALEATGNNDDAVQILVQHLRNEPSSVVRKHTLTVLSKYNTPSRG